MDLKSLIGLIKKPKSPVEELERALGDIDIPAAEQKVEALERQRRELLLGGSNDEVAALDAKIRDANLDVERLAAMQETLTQRIATMRSEGAQEARRKAYAAAQRAYDAGRDLLEEYEKNAKAIAINLGKLAELDQQIDAANADLPEGAHELPSVEAKLRGLPAEPAREVKREVIRTAWYYDGDYVPSAEIPEAMLQDAKLDGNVGTVFDRSRSSATALKVRRCQVVQITLRDAVPPLGAYVLSGAVTLPGVQPGSSPIWGDRASHTTEFAWQGYNREGAIEQATQATSNIGEMRDPRAEPFLRKENRIIPLGTGQSVDA